MDDEKYNTSKVMSRHWMVLIAFLGIFLGAGAGRAQDDNRRLQLIDAPSGPIGPIWVQEGIAYGVQGQRIFKMPLDGPEAYTITARVTVDRPILGMTSDEDGDVLVLTDSGIQQIDAATFTFGDFIPVGATTLDVLGEQWVVASREDGLRVLGRNPRQILLSGDALDAAWLDSAHIAVADQAYGLRIIDDRPSDNPTRIAAATMVAVDGTTIYALDGHRITILDATNPDQPQIIGNYTPIYQPRRVVTTDDWLIVADLADGLKVYDRNLRYSSSQIDNPAYSVALDPTGRWLVSSHARQVKIYNARRLPNLVEEASVPLWAAPDMVRFTTDGLALVTMQAGGIGVIELDTGEVLSALPFSGPVVDVLPIGSRWVVLQNNGRLLVLSYDRRNPSNIQVYADLDMAGQPQMLARDGDQLLVATGRAGLQVFNYNSSGGPTLAYSLRAHAAINAIYVTEQGWLLQDGHQLRLYDPRREQWLSEQTIPDLRSIHVAEAEVYAVSQSDVSVWTLDDIQLTHRQTYPAITQFMDVVAKDDALLLATDGGGIWLDVQNPQRVHEVVLRADELGAVRHVAMHDDDVLIADDYQVVHFSRQQLTTDDIAEQGRLVLADRVERDVIDLPVSITSQIPTAITSSLQRGNLVWLGTDSGQVWQVDLANEAVSARGQIAGGAVLHIAPTNDPLVLLLSSGDNGLGWFDLSSGQIIRWADVSAVAAALDATGQWVALARGQCGLQIYRVEDLSLVASDQWGAVSAVAWQGFMLDVVLDGFRARYVFDPEKPTPQAPILLQAETPTANVLRWRSSADGCVPVQYEVWIDGERVSTTTDTTWPLIGIQNRQVVWSIVAVDAFGNRSQSGTWLLEGDRVGWMRMAQQYQPILVQTQPDESVPYWVYGIGLLAIGVAGLGVLARFWRR